MVFIAILLIIAPTSLIEAASKNPKVAEIENYLTSEGISYLKGRFPSVPLLFNE